MSHCFISCRFFSVRIFLLILSFASTTLTLRINCDYVAKQSVISECVAYDLEVKHSNETVTSISGNLPGVIDYETIKTFRVKFSPLLEFIPSGIEKFFPNIEEIIISQSGLTNLTQDNLKNFSNLRSLILNNNKLEHLDSDVFEFNDKIEEIDLGENRIKVLRVESLKVLKNLKKIDLSNNQCINQTAENQLELKRLKIKLSENCSPSSPTSYFDFFVNIVFFVLLAVLFVFLLIFVINCVVDK